MCFLAVCGLWVWGVGIRVSGLGLRDWGLRFKALQPSRDNEGPSRPDIQL